MTGKNKRRLGFTSLAGVLAAITASVSFAAIPDAGGVIHACYNAEGSNPSGALRVIDTASTANTAKCQRYEKPLNFNQTGPAGAQGIQGAKGLPGSNGTNGTNGTDGTNGTNGIDGARGPAGPPGSAGSLVNITDLNGVPCDSPTQQPAAVRVHVDPQGGTQAAVTLTCEPTAKYTLTVATAGNGAADGIGAVITSDRGGIHCPSICSADYAATTLVTLTATSGSFGSDTGAAFDGWSGACTGTGACTVTMDAARTVTATFTRYVTLQVIVNQEERLGTNANGDPQNFIARGQVTVDGQTCRALCSVRLATDRSYNVDETPLPNDGVNSSDPGAVSVFTGWSNDCASGELHNPGQLRLLRLTAATAEGGRHTVARLPIEHTGATAPSPEALFGPMSCREFGCFARGLAEVIAGLRAHLASTGARPRARTSALRAH